MYQSKTVLIAGMIKSEYNCLETAINRLLNAVLQTTTLALHYFQFKTALRFYLLKSQRYLRPLGSTDLRRLHFGAFREPKLWEEIMTMCHFTVFQNGRTLSQIHLLGNKSQQATDAFSLAREPRFLILTQSLLLKMNRLSPRKPRAHEEPEYQIHVKKVEDSFQTRLD